jgi:hypothetical protein
MILTQHGIFIMIISANFPTTLKKVLRITYAILWAISYHPMIESQHQIDFIHSGGTLRLLDIGAIVSDDPVIAVKQNEQRYAALGASWSENQALGGAETALTWTAVRNHASHAVLHGFCMSHAAAFPSGKTGTLQITISGGEATARERRVRDGDRLLSQRRPSGAGGCDRSLRWHSMGIYFAGLGCADRGLGCALNIEHRTPNIEHRTLKNYGIKRTYWIGR